MPFFGGAYWLKPHINFQVGTWVGENIYIRSITETNFLCFLTFPSLATFFLAGIVFFFFSKDLGKNEP